MNAYGVSKRGFHYVGFSIYIQPFIHLLRFLLDSPLFLFGFVLKNADVIAG